MDIKDEAGSPRPRPFTPTTAETYSGRRIELLHPTAADIDPLDIAVSLARLPRYNGQARQHYSVAQHSVLMSRAIGNTHSVAVWALLHDAHEAYLGDWSRPLQNTVRYYSQLAYDAIQQIRDDTDAAICERFGITVIEADRMLVKHLDNQMLAIEAEQLMVSQGIGWADAFQLTERHGQEILWDGYVWDEGTSQVAFLGRMKELKLV